MVMYLFAGALHGVCEIDVSSPLGSAAVAMSPVKDADHGARGLAAEHHCHGCFQVTMPAPVVAAALVEPDAVMLPQPRAQQGVHAVGIDTPPPKHLT